MKHALRTTGVALAIVLVAAGCGGRRPAAAGGGQGAAAAVNLSLDWVPNPDHVGLYYAMDKGYFDRQRLRVTMHAPSDPSAPIKLVGLNKVDLAISYEPEVFIAGQKGLAVTSVAALIPVPLNSIIALPGSGIARAADLKGRKVGITGIPSDSAILTTAERAAGLGPHDLTPVNVGYNLVQSLLSRKVDAILGGYRNVEAIQVAQETGKAPVVLPVDRVGVPAYDELVVVANAGRLRSSPAYADLVRRFLAALVAASTAAEADRAGAVAVMRKATDYKPSFLAASVPMTLELMRPQGAGAGCMSVPSWRSYGDWMHRTGLIGRAVDAGSIMTDQYLPAPC